MKNNTAFFKMEKHALVITRARYTFIGNGGEYYAGITEEDVDTGYIYFPRGFSEGVLNLEFDVYCEENTEAHFLIYPGSAYDIYIDGMHVCAPSANLPYCMLLLHRGINCFKVSAPYKENGSVFIRLNSFENEASDTEISVLCDNLRNFNGEANIVKSKKTIAPGEDFSFSVWPYDYCSIDVERGCEVECSYLDSELVIAADYCSDIQVNGIFTKEAPEKYIEPVYLKCRVYLRNGEERLKTYRVFVVRKDKLEKHLLETADKLLDKSKGFSDETMAYLKHIKRELTCLEDKLSNILFVDQAYHDLQNLDDVGDENYVNRRGAYTMYRKFKFSSDIFPCHVYAPTDYDPSRKYPLILLCTISPTNNFSKHFRTLDEDVIVVDVSGRGITTGSYIGEASFLETVDFIFEKFSIDKERVYLVGHSNGAFAVWAMAQAYPHMFAGMLTVSGAMFKDKIRNVSNIPVINVSATHDYMISSVKLSEREAKQIEDYTYLECDGVPHAKLGYIKGNIGLLKKLISKKRRLYPRHIRYATDRERHNKAYWVRIDGISHGSRRATVKADVDGNNITVYCRGCAGLTLNPPPYINRRRFTVKINNRVFKFENEKYGELYFKHGDGGFVLADKPSEYCETKGNGLLDVYLDPLTVFSSCEELDSSAYAYAEPMSNGFNPNIRVSYPIVKMYDTDIFDLLKLFEGRSAVIVDSCSDNAIFDLLKHFCPIRTDKDGYEYMGERYDGKYCVMQIVDNPFSKGHHILYVNSNDSTMRNSVIFNRRLIMPSYANGLNDYLNNFALIRSKSGYFRVLEPGLAAENISNKK